MGTIAKPLSLAKHGPQTGQRHIPVLLHATRIMSELEECREGLVLQAVHERLDVPKSTAFRILATLVHRGYVVRTPQGVYKRSQSASRKRNIAVLAESLDEAIRGCLTEAATAAGICLTWIPFKPHPDEDASLAARLIHGQVDLVAFLRYPLGSTSRLADLLARSKVPTIAIDTPQPHAHFLGVDDYRLGFHAGELIASHLRGISGARRVFGLDSRSDHEIVHPRLVGVMGGLTSKLPKLPAWRFERIPGCDSVQSAGQILVALMHSVPARNHVVLFAATQEATIAAARFALERPELVNVQIVGVGDPEIIFRNDDRPPAVASLLYPRLSEYGAKLMELSLGCLNGSYNQPYNYIPWGAVSCAPTVRPTGCVTPDVSPALLHSGGTFFESRLGA